MSLYILVELYFITCDMSTYRVQNQSDEVFALKKSLPNCAVWYKLRFRKSNLRENSASYHCLYYACILA